MPTAYVTKLAKEHHVSVEEAEGVWEQAKSSVEKKDGKEQWPIIMTVFQKMMNERSKKHRK